jgi:beta-carotene ketolase (CrtW type)
MQKQQSARGLMIAATVIMAWTGHLIWLLSKPLNQYSLPFIVLGVLVQSFLYTGLFITAHDAMHGSIWQARYRLNRIVGTIAVRLYAFFSFNNLLEKHSLHHRYPASENDPDYHDGQHTGFFSWYVRFMSRYVSWSQLLGMAVLFNILLHLFHVDIGSLLVFWVIPAFVSTAQLFTFGTYLPHREPPHGYDNRHRARSNRYSKLLSFLSCYHFGYHWEHHEYPFLAWWNLPTVHHAQNPDRRHPSGHPSTH